LKRAFGYTRKTTINGTDKRDRFIFSYYSVLKNKSVPFACWDLASTDNPGGQWIGMHPKLAWVYMTALAEQLSGEHGLRPLTDETRDHMALSGLSMERLAHALLEDVVLVDNGPTNTEMEATMVTVAFKAVIPKAPMSLSVDKILTFREKHPNERSSFQNAVNDLLQRWEWLTKILDPLVLEERLREEYEKN
jgi:hypothetical protein